MLVATITLASCPPGGAAFVMDLDSGDDVFGTSVSDIIDKNNDPFVRNDADLTDGTAMCVPAVPDLVFANGFE